MEVPAEIWTVGHSRLTLENFVGLLRKRQIEVLADVRRYAVSHLHPHFNEMSLYKSLADVGIDYEAFPELGGRRRPASDSPNTRWRNDSFRGYADFMATPEFHRGIERLMALAARKRTAMMCAESLWWRCHRALVSDYLKTQGVKVIHILGMEKIEEHPYTSAARLVDGKLTYAPEEKNLLSADP